MGKKSLGKNIKEKIIILMNDPIIQVFKLYMEVYGELQKLPYYRSYMEDCLQGGKGTREQILAIAEFISNNIEGKLKDFKLTEEEVKIIEITFDMLHLAIQREKRGWKTKWDWS